MYVKITLSCKYHRKAVHGNFFVRRECEVHFDGDIAYVFIELLLF
jgi:hypothetical protein